MSNSRQFSFYMTQQDHAELEGCIRDQVDWTPLAGVTGDSRPHVLNTTIVSKMGQERLGIYLCQPARVDDVVLSQVAGQSDRFVEALRSPVIEFDRCYQSLDSLRLGRLYYVTSYFDDSGALISKDQGFLEWADRIFKAFRKHLVRQEDGYYYGPEAERLKGKLCFLT